MRPTDENQHGSTRPNLLSGGRRRYAGDDNILERLERDSARHASGNRSRAAWYAASALLMLVLIVFVAWMAFDNASSLQVVPMARAPADTGQAVAQAALPPPAGAQLPQLAPSSSAEASSAIPADAPPVHAREGAVAALPPLVLLPQHEAPGNRVRPNTASVATATAATNPAPRARAVARTSMPAPRVAPARTAPRPAAVAKIRKPVPGAPAEPPVDTDVALLSAIIIHDSTHAAEKAQMEAAATCARNAEKRCGSRSAAGKD